MSAKRTFLEPKELAKSIISPDVATDYSIDVVLGKKYRVGTLVYWSCLRHLRDIYQSLTDNEYPYFYDAETAGHVIDFARLLKHYKGEWVGQYFEPEPWQEFIVCSLFGWLRHDNGKRRFRYGYTQIGRKNGKTFLAAVIKLWLFLMDGEGGAEVYSCANTREQARITWNDAVTFLKRCPDFEEMVAIRHAQVRCHETDSVMIPLASDSKHLDGLNPHGVIYDELHAAENRLLWDVIEDAFGARSQPLMFIITTAGFDKYSICYEQRRHCENVLETVVNPELQYNDDTYFSYIAEPDPGDDPYDESTWIKGNPNLNISKTTSYVREQAEKAKNMPGKEPSFLTKQLDVWTNVSSRWLNVNLWLKAQVIKPGKNIHHKACYAGLDLSTNTDVTAFVRLFSPGTVHPDRFYVLPSFFFPEDNLRQRSLRDKVPYTEWAKDGWLHLTPGNSVDTAYIREAVEKANKETFVQALGVDPWKAVALVSDFEMVGFNCFMVYQGYKAMTAPCMLLERLILKDMLAFDGNPMFTWMIGNVAISYDSNENMKPDKENSNERIDGVSALLTALAVFLEEEGAPPILTIA